MPPETSEFTPAQAMLGSDPSFENHSARYALCRADMLARIDALVCGGNFAPEVLREMVELARELAGSAIVFGDPVTGDLALALEECVRGFAAGGESAIRQAAAALQPAA